MAAPAPGTGAPVGRRDALGSFLLVAGGQVAALSLLRPSRTYEKPSEWMVAAFQTQKARSVVPADGDLYSESEVFKFQRRLRKVQDSVGVSDMEKIADAMGLSFNCMNDELCRRSAFDVASGYD